MPGDGKWNELLEELENASQIPARLRSSKVSILVDRVCSKAYEEGLPQASLAQLINIITLPNELDQRSVGSLIKNLYPVGNVADSEVINVVGSLGHGKAKPSLTSQKVLLKWLAMVYDVLENQRTLSKLYAVLFDLLDTIALRSQLCHVLSLITRRAHVRPFRIQALMELTRRAGNDPPLVGLMRVYKDYYSDIIVGDVTIGRASVFTHPNPEWKQRLGEIQDAHLQKTQEGLISDARAFKTTRYGTRTRKPPIPEMHTSHAHPSSTTLEEVGSAEKLVRKLEKIALPNQMVAVMGNPLLQKFLQLRSSEATLRRVDNWLVTFFEDQLHSSGSEGRILDMLDSILKYSRFTKHIPLACLAYLKSMLPTWNGSTGRDTVLKLLAYSPPEKYEELRRNVFLPVETAIIDDTIESRLALLTFYNDVLDEWGVHLLSESEPAFPMRDAINSLLAHVQILALTILQESSEVAAHSTVLKFYETVVYLITQPSTNLGIVIPSTTLVHTIQFTQSISSLSRLCSILAHYKRAFELAATAHQNDSSETGNNYSVQYTNHFNGFLMDLCNCLWRSRAFNTTDPNARGCIIDTQAFAVFDDYIVHLDNSVQLNSLFSLSYSPVTCTLAIEYMRELEDAADGMDIETRHAGPVTQTSLAQLERDGGLRLSWADYRMGVLRFLENKGILGIGELMYNTMKHLMAAREKAGWS